MRMKLTKTQALSLLFLTTCTQKQTLDSDCRSLKVDTTPVVVVELKKEKIEESRCSPDMITISGNMLGGPPDQVEKIQDSTCTTWLNKEFPARCATFDKTAWDREKKKIPRLHLEFCIDKFEWPNKEGSSPLVFVSWLKAGEMCSSVGKRLCTEDEWTFACEGEEGTPYPYGYSRDSSACNIDKPWMQVDEAKLGSSSYQDELKKLWQGVPSGSMTKCVSSTGVHDMTGNVDEWTTSTRRSGYSSVLKGGYWSVVRNRCRPSTRAHNEEYRYYQQGFRCCSSLIK